MRTHGDTLQISVPGFFWCVWFSQKNARRDQNPEETANVWCWWSNNTEKNKEKEKGKGKEERREKRKKERALKAL